ncbi:MAG: DinB family protein [Chloroflexi bacterium]|nr:DinB family protein [Chloroflexota bacterium]
MKYRIGVENNSEGIRSIAWMLDHPGCYAYGKDEAEAIANSPTSVRAYAEWLSHHGASWVSMQEETIPAVEQVWVNYVINQQFERVQGDGYEVEPFFEHDWKPLTDTDIERGMKLLAWSRADLLALLEKLTPDQWAYKKERERWDIAGIVNHIGSAEWWYMDRLGLAFPRADVPNEPLDRISKVRDLINSVLPTLKDVNQVVGLEGELWSPRKVLRRALWHERDHTEHIQKILFS